MPGSRALSITLLVVAGLLAGGRSAPAGESETAEAGAPSPPPGLKLETLLKHTLEGVEGTDVIVSRVTIPPNTALPKHWHPGEEFAYILEGTVTLWQEGKDDLVAHAGEAALVPLKQVHTAMTGDEAATVLVFRVHEHGQPERFPVE